LPFNFALGVDEGSGGGPDDEEGSHDEDDGRDHDAGRGRATTLTAALHCALTKSLLLSTLV